MNNILFKGYDGNEWLLGSSCYYNEYEDQWYMLRGTGVRWAPVDKVYRYTGVRSEEGNQIFEGDRIVIDNQNPDPNIKDHFTGTVEMVDGCWVIKDGAGNTRKLVYAGSTLNIAKEVTSSDKKEDK